MQVPEEIDKKELLKAKLRDSNVVEHYIKKIFHEELEQSKEDLNTRAGLAVVKANILVKLEKLSNFLNINMRSSELVDYTTPVSNVVILRYKISPYNEMKILKADIGSNK